MDRKSIPDQGNPKVDRLPNCSSLDTANKNFTGINNLLKTILKNILAFSKKVINLGADSYLCDQISDTELF